MKLNNPILRSMDLSAAKNRSRMAVLAAVVVISGACAEQSSGIQAASDESAVASTPTTATDGPEYGATLDEFLGEEAEQGEPAALPDDGFELIDWKDLVPAGFSEEEMSARFDERIAEVEPGTPEADAVFAELQEEFDNQPVNTELAGSDIRLEGFVAPLTYEGDLVTEFLLVPYFGACVHVPPPPPNQTVMVTLEGGQGLTIDESWGAVWVTGTMTVDAADTELARAGYSIVGAQTGVYETA